MGVRGGGLRICDYGPYPDKPADNGQQATDVYHAHL